MAFAELLVLVCNVIYRCHIKIHSEVGIIISTLYLIVSYTTLCNVQFAPKNVIIAPIFKIEK